MMRFPIAISLLTTVLVAACSSGPAAPPAVAPPPPPPPLAVPMMPTPPASASANFVLPAKRADGSFVTINQGLSKAATVWHMRSAFNVAVLGCPDAATLSPRYNQFLKTHATPLKRAYSTMTAEYKGRNLDQALTRVYNYFAQPPAQQGFCAAMAVMLDQALTTKSADLEAFAVTGLEALDAPFIDFYRAYESYRVALADWQEKYGPKPIVQPVSATAIGSVSDEKGNSSSTSR